MVDPFCIAGPTNKTDIYMMWMDESSLSLYRPSSDTLVRFESEWTSTSRVLKGMIRYGRSREDIDNFCACFPNELLTVNYCDRASWKYKDGHRSESIM